MIVKTIDLAGRVKYFQTATGKEVRLQREVGRHQRHIPDDVMRFLSPKIENLTGNNKSITDSVKEVDFSKSRFKVNYRNVPTEKPSLLFRFWQWLKSIFNGSK